MVCLNLNCSAQSAIYHIRFQFSYRLNVKNSTHHFQTVHADNHAISG